MGLLFGMNDFVPAQGRCLAEGFRADLQGVNGNREKLPTNWVNWGCAHVTTGIQGKFWKPRCLQDPTKNRERFP